MVIIIIIVRNCQHGFEVYESFFIFAKLSTNVPSTATVTTIFIRTSAQNVNSLATFSSFPLKSRSALPRPPSLHGP